MAGMFYSAQEAAEKLNTTKEHLDKMVQDGKLREFRDGANVLFKVEEVEALKGDEGIAAAKEAPSEEESMLDTGEISLAPESAEQPTDADLLEADTVAGEEAIDVVGETDSEGGTADLLAETGGATGTADLLAETKGTGAEPSLEEIEEDVNLDTFGSGSGLLDLSLQADDTSLGGILDEIYTSESAQDTSEGAALEAVAEEAPAISEEAEAPSLEATPEVPAAVAQVHAAEQPPDTVSNALGIMLFLPVLVVIYTVVVIAAGISDVIPSALSALNRVNGPAGIHMIWYVMAGLTVVSMLIFGGSSMLGGAGAKAAKKSKAPKRPKPRKPKKAKKAKTKK